VQGPARLGAVQAREPAGAAAPVRGRRRRMRGDRGQRFRSRVSACSRDPPGRGRALRFQSCAQLLRRRGSYTTWASGKRISRGKIARSRARFRWFEKS